MMEGVNKKIAYPMLIVVFLAVFSMPFITSIGVSTAATFESQIEELMKLYLKAHPRAHEDVLKSLPVVLHSTFENGYKEYRCTAKSLSDANISLLVFDSEIQGGTAHIKNDQLSYEEMINVFENILHSLPEMESEDFTVATGAYRTQVTFHEGYKASHALGVSSTEQTPGLYFMFGRMP